MVFPLSVLCVLPLLVGSTPGSQELFPSDCSDVYTNGQTLSGVYTIYPTADTPVQVYCDMGCMGNVAEDGNWTVGLDVCLLYRNYIVALFYIQVF